MIADFQQCKYKSSSTGHYFEPFSSISFLHNQKIIVLLICHHLLWHLVGYFMRSFPTETLYEFHVSPVICLVCYTIFYFVNLLLNSAQQRFSYKVVITSWIEFTSSQPTLLFIIIIIIIPPMPWSFKLSLFFLFYNKIFYTFTDTSMDLILNVLT